MTAGVDANVLEACPLAKPLPDCIAVLQVALGLLARNDPRVALDTRNRSKHMRHPVLPSPSRSWPAVRSTVSHLSVTISFLQQPVSSRRTAGMADGNAEPSASASSSTRPSARYSSGERKPRGGSRDSAGSSGTGCAAAACTKPRQAGTSSPACRWPRSSDRASPAAWNAASRPAGVHPRQGQMAQFRHDVEAHEAPKGLGRLLAAAHPHMGTHAARGEVGDGGLGHRRRRERIKTLLDAVDDPRPPGAALRPASHRPGTRARPASARRQAPASGRTTPCAPRHRPGCRSPAGHGPGPRCRRSPRTKHRRCVW